MSVTKYRLASLKDKIEASAEKEEVKVVEAKKEKKLGSKLSTKKKK